MQSNETIDHDADVRQAYSRGAQARVEELCCPISYDASFLQVIPAEVIERDYGCGDPSRHLSPGETVLDLGSGGGKMCFIAAQVVGERGNVIGVDINDDMLALARRNAPIVAERIGFANVEFLEGRIQDMRGLIGDGAIDVVMSNCVLNLVRPKDKAQLFTEIARVLHDDGRAVISDIVSDKLVPAHMQQDPELWCGCISGALREDQFIEAFRAVGFQSVEVEARQQEPWQVHEGIEFRSLTVTAYKGAKASDCRPSNTSASCC